MVEAMHHEPDEKAKIGISLKPSLFSLLHKKSHSELIAFATTIGKNHIQHHLSHIKCIFQVRQKRYITLFLRGINTVNI